MDERVSKWNAVILAAGRSQRFGAPKVLQTFNGLPFLTRIRNNVQSAGIREIFLVLGHQARELIPRLPDAQQFKLVINPQYDLGQLSSLQAALREVPATVQGVLLCLVDQPHVPAMVYQELLGSALQQPEMFLVPEYEGRGGHPIIIPALFFQEILNADARQNTLKDIMRNHAQQVKRIPVSEPAILEDIDTREQWTKLQQKYKT